MYIFAQLLIKVIHRCEIFCKDSAKNRYNQIINKKHAKVMLSFLNCKLINNCVEREVSILQVYFPYSRERYIQVNMYSTRSCKKRKIFTRIYEVPSRQDFDVMYYKLLDHYKTCTCKQPIML